MRDERGGGRLAVGAGDADAPGSPERQESDIHLRMNRYAGLPGGLERRHVRRDARRHHHRDRPRDPVELVSAEMDGGAGRAELRGPFVEGRAGADIGRVGRDPVISKEQRRGDAALAESHDRYLAAAGAPGLQ
jgi:hypothetical protein